MSIYFTKYSEDKFHILNRHGVFFTHEQIEDCIKLPDKIKKRINHFEVEHDGIKVIYKKEVGVIMVLTFYPTK